MTFELHGRVHDIIQDNAGESIPKEYANEVQRVQRKEEICSIYGILNTKTELICMAQREHLERALRNLVKEYEKGYMQERSSNE